MKIKIQDVAAGKISITVYDDSGVELAHFGELSMEPSCGICGCDLDDEIGVGADGAECCAAVVQDVNDEPRLVCRRCADV